MPRCPLSTGHAPRSPTTRSVAAPPSGRMATGGQGGAPMDRMNSPEDENSSDLEVMPLHEADTTDHGIGTRVGGGAASAEGTDAPPSSVPQHSPLARRRS